MMSNLLLALVQSEPYLLGFMTGAISFGCGAYVFGWSYGREEMANELAALMREDRVGWADPREGRGKPIAALTARRMG
jgi:hypothetical protein